MPRLLLPKVIYQVYCNRRGPFCRSSAYRYGDVVFCIRTSSVFDEYVVGVNAIFYYGPQIIAAAGFDNKYLLNIVRFRCWIILIYHVISSAGPGRMELCGDVCCRLLDRQVGPATAHPPRPWCEYSKSIACGDILPRSQWNVLFLQSLLSDCAESTCNVLRLADLPLAWAPVFWSI